MCTALALCVVLSPHSPDLSAVPFFGGQRITVPRLHLANLLCMKTYQFIHQSERATERLSELHSSAYIRELCDVCPASKRVCASLTALGRHCGETETSSFSISQRLALTEDIEEGSNAVV